MHDHRLTLPTEMSVHDAGFNVGAPINQQGHDVRRRCPEEWGLAILCIMEGEEAGNIQLAGIDWAILPIL